MVNYVIYGLVISEFFFKLLWGKVRHTSVAKAVGYKGVASIMFTAVLL